jgi:hypothetical protein
LAAGWCRGNIRSTAPISSSSTGAISAPYRRATAARQLENHVKRAELNDAVEDIGRHVDQPIMAEILDGEIPEDDWQPPGEPVQHASEKAPAQKDNAPAARMTMKRGVTKIARSK